MLSKRFELTANDFIIGSNGQVEMNQNSISSMIHAGLQEVVPMSARRASIVQISVTDQKDIESVEGHEPKTKNL